MISVCIATFNGEKYIREQIASIIPQIGIEDEIVISDDSSTDKTIEIINSFKDKRIQIFPNQNFHSPIFNFENAIKHARGDCLFLCDQDDVWMPNKVVRMMDALKKADLVVSDCKVVDANLNEIYKSLFMLNHASNGFWRNWIKNSYTGCCMAFKREMLNFILPFPPKIAMHDSWIGLSGELHSKVSFIYEPLILYRRHGNNVSFGGEKSKFSLLYRINYRFYMLWYLLKRRYICKYSN